MKKILFLTTLFSLMLTGCFSDNSNKIHTLLEEEITLVAPSSIGGSWDLTARAMQQTLNQQGIIKQPVSVTNIVGEGGKTGWKYIKEAEQGNVLAMNSSLILTSSLLGESQLTYQDFTPLATLAVEWVAVIVSKDSNINSANELITSLRNSVDSVNVGVSPKLGNDDQISFVLASQHSGIQPQGLDFFVYENSNLVVNALMSNEVDVATMPLSEAKKFYDAGTVKILAISSPERLEEMPEIPTWTEQGIDLVFQHWRGVMGPPTMTEAEIQYWDDVFYKMVQTDQWNQFLKDHNWSSLYKNSSETALFLEEQSEFYEKLMLYGME